MATVELHSLIPSPLGRSLGIYEASVPSPLGRSLGIYEASVPSPLGRSLGIYEARITHTNTHMVPQKLLLLQLVHKHHRSRLNCLNQAITWTDLVSYIQLS